MLGSLHSHTGNYLIVTAKPGYELIGGDSPVHIGGGGHGSLDKTDSMIPLLILGTNERPRYLRIEDIKKLYPSNITIKLTASFFNYLLSF
ncbi:hypothetical protein [Tepidibacillus marianensis]|uniref:hypothetical protein n=1 Tax=Tepidibacillus marianensis TaxID=3131995 RepID=UPI0030D1B604